MYRQIESAQQALTLLDEAAAANQLTAGAVANIRAWLTDARYAEYVPQVVEHVQQKKWRELDDAFWTIIPFGTGGRRGKMYPIGSNAINDRTMGESAQGLAEYVRQVHGDGAQLSCAIAYDTRHRSRHFAELCAEIMVASGFKVYFLDGVRSTPECSLAVRQSRSTCGIMITASHNPPSDNAVKAYPDKLEKAIAVTIPYQVGIAVPKDKPKFREAVHAALMEIYKSGDQLTLLKKWNLDPNNLMEPGLLMVK